MKLRFAAAGLLLAVFLTGCSQSDSQSSQDLQSAQDLFSSQDTESIQETMPATEEKKLSGLVYYITDHGTVSPTEVSSFMADLTEIGYTVETDVLSSVPIGADAVILNSPSEDITPEELDILDSYMDEGGHILLFMPADGRELRYKYLELLLDEYCIEMDYDLISETDEANMLENDPEHVLITEIDPPEGMSVPTEGQPVYQHNVRSFHLVFRDNYSAIKQDAMLETAFTAVGTPYGGTEDDPMTYEEELLMTMVYSRNDQRLNSMIIAAGSSDFLLDKNYAADASLRMQEWVFASLRWVITYL